MFAEELTKIRESEAQAEQILRQAKLDAKRSLAEAAQKAEQIIEDAKNRSRTREDTLIAEGESIAASQYEETLAHCRQQCQELTAQAASRENRAIELIRERIESGVNR